MPTSAISGLNPFLVRIRRRKIEVVTIEPEWRRLIRKCYQLWDAYQKHPDEHRRARLEYHLDLMCTSRSRKVKEVQKEISSIFKAKAFA